MTARIISDRLVVEHDPAACDKPGRLTRWMAFAAVRLFGWSGFRGRGGTV